jgi:AraC-like DNA-binding protein
MTIDRLNDHVKRAIGVSAGHLIRQRLMTEAKRLLVFTTQPIQDIAQELSFSDPSHFARIFRKHTGTTPRSAAFARWRWRHYGPFRPTVPFGSSLSRLTRDFAPRQRGHNRSQLIARMPFRAAAKNSSMARQQSGHAAGNRRGSVLDHAKQGP